MDEFYLNGVDMLPFVKLWKFERREETEITLALDLTISKPMRKAIITWGSNQAIYFRSGRGTWHKPFGCMRYEPPKKRLELHSHWYEGLNHYTFDIVIYFYEDLP